VRARLSRRSDQQRTGGDAGADTTADTTANTAATSDDTAAGTSDDTTAATSDDIGDAAAAAEDPGRPNERPSRKTRRPLYHRLLRLRHISPSGWQRAAFADGPLVVAIVLVLADLASAWTLLVLPLAVAVVVKAHDVLAGLLARPPASRDPGPD
jgi:hypothetical protein